MPISITRSNPDEVPQPSRHLALVPVELYFRLGFRELTEAREWAERAVDVLREVRVETPVILDRIVVWGPRRERPGIRVEGEGYVFLSELALRCLRAVDHRPIPVPEMVSLARLHRLLEMLEGSDIDQQAYDSWVGR